MDLLFVNLGSIVLLSAGTGDGQDWIDENVASEMKLGGATAIEHRYATDILEGAQADGLTVEIEQ